MGTRVKRGVRRHVARDLTYEATYGGRWWRAWIVEIDGYGNRNDRLIGRWPTKAEALREIMKSVKGGHK